jgi:hypothetical protein
VQSDSGVSPVLEGTALLVLVPVLVPVLGPVLGLLLLLSSALLGLASGCARWVYRGAARGRLSRAGQGRGAASDRLSGRLCPRPQTAWP